MAVVVVGRFFFGWGRGGRCAGLPSAMNSRYTFGGWSNLGRTTIPFLTSFRRTFLSANDADWPAVHTDTGMRFLSMDLMLVGMNWPSESGPTRTLSPACIAPCSES